jgi:hypothetical protein
LLDLMPEKAREILGSYHAVKTKQEWWHWRERAAEQIVELADGVAQRTYQGQPIEAPRAKCPLCRAGPESYYDGGLGFALPTGLIRHLTGGHNARQCPVFGAGFALALDYMRDPLFGPGFEM